MYTKRKSAAEIDAIRESGSMLSRVLTYLEAHVTEGMTTKYVADLAARELKGLGGQPAFLGYMGFPDVICISVNDAVVHGIPNTYTLRSGDIVGLDFGVQYRGMITDAARSIIIGGSSPQKVKLLGTTKAALQAGIETLHDGVRVGDIAASIQSVLDQSGLGIVRDLVGHGVGHHVHEDPNIPNFGTKGTGPELYAGMTIAIEPMATLGSPKVYVADDGWTILTRDGSLSAHFEHTVLITDNSYEILTA